MLSESPIAATPLTTIMPGSQDGVLTMWDVHITGNPLVKIAATPTASHYPPMTRIVIGSGNQTATIPAAPWDMSYFSLSQAQASRNVCRAYRVAYSTRLQRWVSMVLGCKFREAVGATSSGHWAPVTIVAFSGDRHGLWVY